MLSRAYRERAAARTGGAGSGRNLCALALLSRSSRAHSWTYALRLCAIDHFIVVVMSGSLAHNSLRQSIAVVSKSWSFNGFPLRGFEMAWATICTKS